MVKKPVVGAVFLLFLGVASRAEAIPTWARKYKTSCATCHEAYPRLTAVGEAFRLNGYRFPENDEAYVRVEPVTLGDPAYKRVWPEAIWPSDIPGYPPVAFRAIADYEMDIGGEEDARSTFQFPHELEVLAGGTLGESFSFFAEVEIEEGGAEAAFFLNWEDLFADALGESRLNLRVGSVGMQTLDLPAAIDHQRLGRSHYLKNDWTLPDPGGLDTMNEFKLGHQPGVEMYGNGSRYKYAFGVVNGQGEPEDNNSEKDVYAQIAFKIGGLGYDGSGTGQMEGDEIPVTPAGGWVDDSVQIGLFAYRGIAKIEETALPGQPMKDRFWRLGADIKAKYQNFGLGAGFIKGKHSKPYGTMTNEDIDTSEVFVEAYYFVLPWVIPAVRYESLAIDVPTTLFTEGQDRARVVPTITLLPLANLRIALEARIHTVNEPLEDQVPSVDKNDDDRAYVRFDWAF